MVIYPIEVIKPDFSFCIAIVPKTKPKVLKNEVIVNNKT
jgi:hypothetical protein